MSSLPDGGRHREAQAFSTVRNGTSKAGDPRGFWKVGAKGEDDEERMVVAKRQSRAPSQ